MEKKNQKKTIMGCHREADYIKNKLNYFLTCNFYLKR